MAVGRERGTVLLTSGNARINPDSGGAALSFNNTSGFVQKQPVFFNRDPINLGWAINVSAVATALALARLTLPPSGATRAARAELAAHLSDLSMAWPNPIAGKQSAEADAELQTIRSKLKDLNIRVGVVAMRTCLAGADPSLKGDRK
ncbi:hypothetical protein ACYZX9_14600 [Sphingomonas citri]